HALRAVEDENLVDRSMTAHERTWPGLKHPRDVCVWRMPFERVDHRQHVHRVADRAHHDDAHTVERRDWRQHASHVAEARRSASISRSIIDEVMSTADGRASMRQRPGPCGNVRSGWPGAKMPSTGTPNAAATCSGPESCPTTSVASDKAPAVVESEPFPSWS